MATENIGTKYNTQIPALSENADIQTALRIYHYGQSSEPTTLNASSVAGYLNSLEDSKVAKSATAIVTGAQNNLNLKKTTGFYYVASTAIATAGSNYPSYKLPDSGSDSGSKYGGILEVVNDGLVVFQTYHMINPGAGGFTAKAWRGSLDDGTTWTPWKQSLNDDHVHDTRYYQKYTSGADKNSTIYNATEVDSALALKATLAGPAAFSGTGTNSPTAVTQSVNDNSTKLATTAFVAGQASSSNPLVNNAVSIGTSLRYSREDHVHPIDTSRAPLNSPNLTGTPVLPATTTLPLYTGGTLSQSAVAMAAAIDGKPNTLLGNKAVSTPVPSGTKRIVIARDNGSGSPDATITPVEGDLWFW